jgi:hypothetical protein
VFEGKPIAVLYRYLVPGTAKADEFVSPVGVTRIDSVTQLQNVKLNLARGADGYTLEAAVPLADLGWQPTAGGKYRGDLGVIYSDQLGTKNGLRMHWNNKATGMVADLFSEAKIQPEQWGEILTP